MVKVLSLEWVQLYKVQSSMYILKNSVDFQLVQVTLNTEFTSLQHLDYKSVQTESRGELVAYYKIAREYVFLIILLVLQTSLPKKCIFRSLQMGIEWIILQA